MRPDTEALDWLMTIMERKYGRLVSNRFFRGTIVTVVGSAGNYQVTIKRTGEKGADGNSYQVAPTYVGTPTVGDKVECMWRDQTTAYAMWKTPT